MVGLWVAATVVTLLHFLRVKDRRLLPLLGLFAFLALALSRDWWDPMKNVFHLAACASGLALVLLLTPRTPPAEKP